MAALTQDQLVYVRRQIGNSPTDAELQVTYDRLADVDQVVLEVLEIRLANLIADPATFSVSGEYSQSTAVNIQALQKKLDEWKAYMIRVGKLVGPEAGESVVRITSPDTTPWR